MKSIQEYSDCLNEIKSLVDEADAIVIGAGSGLSTAAGLTYDGKRFFKYFADFYEKYGITDMYSGGFYPFETAEEYWVWWSRHIFYNRYVEPPVPVYRNLLNLIKNKNYFVITTNVDHCFQRAGFDKSRLFYTQGDYGLFQCSVPCHNKTYDNEETIRRMINEQKKMKIPSELIPRCPICGKPMTVNLRCDETFVEDDGWIAAYRNYTEFLRDSQGKKVVFLELGVGLNTPGIIKYPFWKMTYENPNAFYIGVNKIDSPIPNQIKKRTLIITDDIGKIFDSSI